MCESSRVVTVDSGLRPRYKCKACGVLLYSVRDQDTDKVQLRTYACRHIGKDPNLGKRRLICPKPATHDTGTNTYCDLHGGGPPSHQVARARRQERKLGTIERQRQRDADMDRFANRHVKRVEDEMRDAPPPAVVKDGGGVGGVFIW